MSEQKFYLKRDLYSIVNSRRQYGKKNDEVKIIGRHGHVYAVQGPDGQKFFVLAEDLTSEEVTEKNIISASIEKPPSKVTRKVAGRSAKGNSPSLF